MEKPNFYGIMPADVRYDKNNEQRSERYETR